MYYNNTDFFCCFINRLQSPHSAQKIILYCITTGQVLYCLVTGPDGDLLSLRQVVAKEPPDIFFLVEYNST